MDLSELLNEREWRKCRGPENATPEELAEAFAYFCSNYWFIRHPERGRILFEMREAQTETALAWINHRRTIVLKARQIGFSTLAAAFAFWEIFFWADRPEVMLSRTEREAAKLLQKAKYGYKQLPEWMRQRGPALISDNQLKIVFNNESYLESLPSGNDPARGESLYRIFVDEMAFLPNSEEAWASIEPTVDVGGRVVCLSTANGEGNIFHSLWVGSQTGTNSFKGIFFPWSASDRDDSWYEVKRRELPDWQLAQEYPSDPDEAFIRSGRPVFDLDVIRQIETKEPRCGYLHKGMGRNVYEFREDGGELSIFAFPELDGVYCIGADVAEGLGHGDYSSAHVIDAYNEQVVAHWHGHVDPDLFGSDILYALGAWYNQALMGVENNNHGLTTLKALQRTGYKNIYRQRRLAQRNPQATEILGWRTTAASKPLAVDELSKALRDDELYVPCAKTLGELRTFVREASGKMHGSPHDDRVMSLAIANQMLKHVWLPEYQVSLTPPKNSLLWFEQFIPTEQVERIRVGAFNVRK
jgi:hypothetical protein